MRWRTVVCGFLLISTLWALSGCMLDGRYKYTGSKRETKIIDLEGIEAVEMRLGSADVEIVSGGTDEASFMIRRTYKAREKDYADELLRGAVISFDKQRSTLVVKRKEKKKAGLEMIAKGYVSIDVTATIPADIRLDIVTGSGDFDIDDRRAPIKIRSGSGDIIAGTAEAGLDVRTGSGDVDLRSAKGMVKFSGGSGSIYAGEIEGDLEASTGSGDISIESVLGNVSVTSGSGDILVESSEGIVSAKSGSGDIRFGRHAGDAEVLTSSGDIDFCAAAGEAEVRLRSSSGDIDVVLYDGDSIEIEITTSSGSITTKVPVVVKEASRRRLHGILGDGRWKLRVTTSSGDITVKRGSI